MTFIFGELCKLIKVPRVLGHLFVGLIFGIPFIKDRLFNLEILTIIDSLAEIGIIFLFFFVGLNINLREFKFNFKESFLISLFNFLLPLTAGFLISRFFLGFEVLTSLIVGITLSATSQVFAVNLLEELKIFKTKVGNLIITSGATNDVFELILVSVILAVLNAETAYIGLSKKLINIFIFIILLFLLRFIIFPHIIRFFESNKSTTSLFSGAIIIALVTSLLSDLFGLGILVGALFSGLIIRQILLTGKHPKPWEEHSIANSIHLVSYGFLVPIFFVSAGIKTNLSALISDLNLVVIFLAVSLLGTLGGSIFGVLLSKGNFKEGALVGFGISSRGDLEIVISTLALEAGLFTQIMHSSIIVMAFLTTLISPFMFRYLSKKYRYYLNVNH